MSGWTRFMARPADRAKGPGEGGQPHADQPSAEVRGRQLGVTENTSLGGMRMNPIEKTMRRIDAAQQRFGPAAMVFGVMKKFGDDNGGNLVSNLAFSAFLCVFPLLLILVTVLDLV